MSQVEDRLIRYELTGLGEPHALEASDVKVARLACWLVGQGQYGLLDGDGQEVMPVLRDAGDQQLLEWIAANIGDRPVEFHREHPEQIAAALESVQPAGALRDQALNKAAWFRKHVVEKGAVRETEV